MPIYQFVCKSCETPFTELLFGAEQPTCPSCQGHSAEKQFSTFASPKASGSSPGSSPFAGSDGAFASGPCGSCGDPRGPGSCAT
jgi:putative FmdB family regulatory protein